MDWNDLRIFLAVSRAGSLGAAAKCLGVSHPTVGRRLSALEHASGQVLLRRTPGGLVLTASGERIQSLAEVMERSALSIERRLAGTDVPVEGLLRISSADWFAGYVLAPVLAELLARHPLIVPELMVGPRLFDLTRREADLAFRIVPFTEPDIVQRRLMTMPYGLYLSAQAPEHMESEEEVGLILMDTVQAHYPCVQWLQRRYPRARTAFTSSSRTVQAQACALGLGVAVLPRPLGDQSTALRRIDGDDAPPGRDIWMGYHHDMSQMDRLRALADLMVERLGGEIG